jgi:hypothetical protein
MIFVAKNNYVFVPACGLFMSRYTAGELIIVFA